MKLDGGFVGVRLTEEQMDWCRALARYRSSTLSGVLRSALVEEWKRSKDRAEKLVKFLEENDQ